MSPKNNESNEMDSNTGESVNKKITRNKPNKKVEVKLKSKFDKLNPIAVKQKEKKAARKAPADVKRNIFGVKHMTEIEWTYVPGYVGRTLNLNTGCTKISPECKHCYAETFLEIKKHNSRTKKFRHGFNTVVAHENELETPATWKQRSAIFVDSLSDLFHKDTSDDFIIRAFEMFNSYPEHIFMVLTKRPERMVALLPKIKLTNNIWVGITCGHESSIPRIETLRQIPARVRFISAEPLLTDLPNLDLSGIHWVIIGGESDASKKRVRPMNVEHARSVVTQCRAAGAKIFMKQWGKVGQDGVWRDKKRNGHLIDGVDYREFPDACYEEGFNV